MEAVAHAHARTRMDKKIGGTGGGRERCLCSFFLWTGGECHEVGPLRNRNSKERARRRWNIRYREFDISLGRTHATAIRIPDYFRRCFAVDSGLPNRSPTVVLKYTERVRSSSFSLPPYLSISPSIYLSFREFLAEFKVDSSLREIRSKSIARHNFLIFNLVIKRGIKTWLEIKSPLGIDCEISFC